MGSADPDKSSAEPQLFGDVEGGRNLCIQMLEPGYVKSRNCLGQHLIGQGYSEACGITRIFVRVRRTPWQFDLSFFLGRSREDFLEKPPSLSTNLRPL